jgi:hypothetical protein
MTLPKERQGEIALVILKEKFNRDRKLPDVQGLKRELGNVSKKTSISKEELIEFVILMVKELTEEFISEVTTGKTGVSK